MKCDNDHFRLFLSCPGNLTGRCHLWITHVLLFQFMCPSCTESQHSFWTIAGKFKLRPLTPFPTPEVSPNLLIPQFLLISQRTSWFAVVKHSGIVSYQLTLEADVIWRGDVMPPLVGVWSGIVGSRKWCDEATRKTSWSWNLVYSLCIHNFQAKSSRILKVSMWGNRWWYCCQRSSGGKLSKLF